MSPAVGNMLCCKGISHKNVARLFTNRVRHAHKWPQEMRVEVHVAGTPHRPSSLVQFVSEKAALTP